MPRFKNPTPYETLTTLTALHSAWRHIYENRHSSSDNTKHAIGKFKENHKLYLGQINRALKKGNYEFEDAKAVFVKDRPIVIATVRDRVVQRALLETLQKLPKIKPFLHSPNSFGAVEEGGVRKAAFAYLQAIRNGATHFYKSDITKFFTKIPLPKIFTRLDPIVNDPQFMDVLKRATQLDIANLHELRQNKELFDYTEVGTPQGCCLSPLMGNILLHEFDQTMTQQNIVCLRYLDDFIILGPSEGLVQKAFNRAKKLLAHDNLTAYEAHINPKKAMAGPVNKSFVYLGLNICGEQICPSAEARSKLFNSIRKAFQDSLNTDFAKVNGGSKWKLSLVRTLAQVSDRLEAWGNQYFFCNDEALWTSLDIKITRLIQQYLDDYEIKKASLKKQIKDTALAERRFLGIHLLVDSKKRPKEFDLTN